MSAPTVYYQLPKGLNTTDLIAGLENQFTVIQHPPRTVQRTFLDTFDWRLFTAGLQLERETDDGTETLMLSRIEQHRILASFRPREPFTFVWDLPAGALRKQLAPILEMRALQPVISLRATFGEYSVLNRDQKTVLRIRIETNKCYTASNKPGAVLNRALVLQAVRGYQKYYDDAQKLLEERFGLQPSQQDVYSKALMRAKIVPGGYSSKLNIPLDVHMRADEACKKILLQLLDTLQTNEQGTIEDIDSEFLHDFRVACRRTRSALSQIKNVFTKKTTERFAREFAWLGGVTGPTRDLDVYLLSFDDYKQRVPKHLQEALEPLREFLRKQQKVEQQKLTHALLSARYRQMIADWRNFLEEPVPQKSSTPNAARPITEVANERTWKMFCRVIDEGLAINDASPPEDLHELRKSCKKLRYLMEFFHNLYPADEITLLIKALKQLQTNLGDYNDVHVQIQSLQGFSEQMLAHEHPSAETLLAMGTLIEGLDKKQQAVRREFESQFSQFNEPQTYQRFEALFCSAEVTAAKAPSTELALS